MIDSREQLIHVLTEAAEVEHNLLCSYLYAAFSLKRAGEGELTAVQGAAVERWRKLIVSVALEEMAHLACVNNLLLAVGGAPHLDRPNLPVAPGYHPAGVVVRLTPFDEATLDHFIFLERPETDDVADGDGFEPMAAERIESPGAITPSAIDYDTIGKLYDSLADGFRRLSARLGETVLIDPSGAGQLGPDEAGLPDVRRIASLGDVLAAIELIKEQGEGASGRREDSHYERFRAIKLEWAGLLEADAAFLPAWPAASDPVMRRPAPDLARCWITAPDAAAQLDFGNALYGAMLGVLSQAFGLRNVAHQAALMTVAIQLMELAAAAGNRLARMPARLDTAGVNAGLSFAAPRTLGVRPGASALHLTERLEELRRRARTILAGEDLQKAEARFANCLAAAAELEPGPPRPHQLHALVP